MGSKNRKDETKDKLNAEIQVFIANDIINVLKKDTKASEKEAESLIDNFVRKYE